MLRLDSAFDLWFSGFSKYPKHKAGLKAAFLAGAAAAHAALVNNQTPTQPPVVEYPDESEYPDDIDELAEE